MELFPARSEQAGCQRPLLRTAQLKIAMESANIRLNLRNEFKRDETFCLLI